MPNESLYGRFFASSYDWFLSSLEESKGRKIRSRYIPHLKGDVLELGSGTGANFAHYAPETRVVACEPSPAMNRIARDRATANIQLLERGVGDPRLEAEIPDGSRDAVVSTLVLCTIPDLPAAVDFCYRKLRPKGQLFIFEHVAAQSRLLHLIQSLLTPLWRPIGRGCHLNRKTDQQLIRKGFTVLEENRFALPGFPFYVAMLEKPAA